MSKTLPLNGFKRVKDLLEFDEGFIKNYNEKSNIGYSLEIDIQYLEESYEFYNDLTYLPVKNEN